MSGSRTGVVSSALGSAPGVAEQAWCDEREVFVELTDGRLVRRELPEWVLAVPADRRGDCVVEDFGTTIWWPKIEDGFVINWLFGVSEDVIYDLAGFTKGPLGHPPEPRERKRRR